MDERWMIDELIEVVDAALEAVDYDGAASGRVREKPDKRTIRYYTTLGLLDRPVEFRGRSAYYGRRHVLQLTAIKRMQGKGMTLVQVQEALAGADSRRLRNWAGLPDEFWDKHRPVAPASPDPDRLLAEPENPQGHGTVTIKSPRRMRTAFWREAPAASETAPGPAMAPDAAAMELRSIAALNLAPGVKLLLETNAAQRINTESLQELAPAAELFVAELRRLKLI
jgi:DNA-binding transcriptional MerR regulator